VCFRNDLKVTRTTFPISFIIFNSDRQRWLKEYKQRVERGSWALKPKTNNKKQKKGNNKKKNNNNNNNSSNNNDDNKNNNNNNNNNKKPVNKNKSNTKK
jgi:hypothetical protein